MTRKARKGGPKGQQRLYAVQGYGDDFHTGTVGDGRQVIMGLLCPNLVAVFFDSSGNFLETQKRALPFMRPKGPYDIYDKRIGPQLRCWQKEIGFRPGTVKVRRFSLPEEGVGIDDLPGHFQEFVDERSQFIESDGEDYREMIRAWQDAGNFVFWWAKDYWMDRDGDVEST
jgi:hypothetical protein